MSMRALYTTTALLALAPAALCQWTTDTLSVARDEIGATSIGTLALFGGGFTGSFTVPPVRYDTVDIYDASTDTWSTATLSMARSWPAATSADGRAFFGGGRNAAGPTRRVDIYDSQADTWTTAELSQGRDLLVAASAAGKVFFAGGRISTDAPSSLVDIYDTQTDTWTTAALSVARFSLAATSVGTLVLFAGGTAPWHSDRVDIYDTSTSTWSTAVLSEARSRLAATSVAGQAFFAGGFSTTVDIFEASSGTWTTANLSVPRNDLGATSVGHWAVFAGGALSTTVDLFDTSTQTWSTTTFSLGRRRIAATTVGGQALFAGGRAGNTQHDTVDVFEPTLGLLYCTPANPNSSGAPARISADGSLFVADQDFTLTAESLPAGEFGYFLVGSNQGTFQPPGSQGILCLACGFQGCGGIGRFNHAGMIIQGPAGSIDVDLASLPLSPPAPVQPGETWNFQCWFRDQGTSNFTDAISVAFL
ncbi:MAG: hypothetical protein GY711_14110 [bacterium]|nr:hypothetical protein [bacterium]